MTGNRIRWKWFVYFVFFAAFLYIGYQVPYCHDEWQWGLDERIELMKTGFKNYNGRYLGNLLALVITRSVWAKGSILAGGLLWLLQTMYQNIRNNGDKTEKQMDIFLMASLIFLLVTLPKTLFSQSYGWPAAFVNFVPPVILFLIYYNWTEQTYTQKKVSYTMFQNIAVVFLGIATQLFSEHITVYVVFYAVWILAFSTVKYKKIHIIYVNYLVGALLGAGVMFSNGAYGRAASETDGYKHILFSVGGMFEQFCSKLWDDLLLNNWILNIVFAGVLVLLITRQKKKNLISIEMAAVFCGYCVYSIFHKIYPSWVFVSNTLTNDIIETALAVLFYANVLLCIWINIEDEKKYSICILYLSAACVAMPLLVANPIGPRCFYVSYIFQGLALAKLLQYLGKNEAADLFYPIVGIAVVTLIVGVIYVRMFSAVGQMNRYRSELIETGIENQQTEIILPILPYSDYFWITVPPNEKWEQRFKKFYHIPENISLIFQ